MRFLSFVVVAVFLLLADPRASATDSCVLPETSCTPGNRFSSVQTALSAAQSPGADRVLIGAGTFSVPSGGLTYNGDRVEIIGAGPAATVLDEPTTAATETALTVTHSGSARSVLRGLGVRIGAAGPPSNPNTGIKARGGVDVSDIRATSDTTSWGIDLDDASTLSSSRVALPLGTASVGVAALAGTGGSAQVSDSTIQAGIG